MSLIVSWVASATLRLPASAAALANWFFLSSCAARRAARCALLLPEGGLMFALALASRASRWPLFHTSRRAAISVLTAKEDAPGI